MTTSNHIRYYLNVIQSRPNLHYRQKYVRIGTSLAVQRLGLCASTAGRTGLILDWGTKIPHASRPKKKYITIHSTLNDNPQI